VIRAQSAPLEGSVQKGPLIIGSTLEVASLDPTGAPLGNVFNTTITDDLGSFEVSFAHQGPVNLIGSGFHYNEILGAVSNAPISLRSLTGLSMGGQQTAYVNVVTHLAERRALSLLDTLSLEQAISSAEQDVVVALGIGPPGFVPGGAGNEMNLLGGSSQANAYLFAVSATLVQAAVIEAGEGGAVDGELQELINALAIDLEDGMLAPNRAALIEEAESAVLPEQVLDRLGARLADLGSPAVLPDLNTVLDTDQDGTEDATDTCPWVANPMQQPRLQDVCLAFARPVAEGLLMSLGAVEPADLDGDNDVDAVLVSGDSTIFLLEGDGTGALTVAHQQPFSNNFVQAADLDDDGTPDLLTLNGQNNDLQVYLRDNSVGPLPVPVTSAIPNLFVTRFAIAPMDGDAFPELLTVDNLFSSGGVALPLRLLINDGVGGFTEGTATGQLPAGVSIAVRTFALADVDNDTNNDAVVAGFSTDFTSARVLVLPGDGSGGLGATTVSTGALGPGDAMNPGAMALADVTGDGVIDLVVARATTLYVMVGNNDGTYAAPVSSNVVFDSSFGGSGAVADFTGDGLDDVAVVGSNGELAILANLGAGSFSPAVLRASRIVGDGGAIRGAADFDQIGASDMLFRRDGGIRR